MPEVRPKENEVIVGSRELRLPCTKPRYPRYLGGRTRRTGGTLPGTQPAQLGARSEELRGDRTGVAHADSVRAKAYMTWAPDPEVEEEGALRLKP